jgi:hypothetical protein
MAIREPLGISMGTERKTTSPKSVRLARLHKVAQGKASGADLHLAREAPCHLALLNSPAATM